MISNRLKNQHLLWRAAFGPMVESVNQITEASQTDLLKLLVEKSSKAPAYLSTAENTADGLYKGLRDFAEMEKLTKEQKVQMRKQSERDIKNLNLSWLYEMINSEAQLREKLSLFWHGHFACRVVNIYFQQQLLDVIRRNALGNFGDLLRGVSKSPSMLSFLNNQQNRKKHPNENFAREVMELFTMGRGNYTEEDIKESARAFTGWGFTAAGEFVERKNQHDSGQKTFLGRTGNFNGDDILDIILEQKATAGFITKKLYAFLVNEEIDEGRVEQLAGRFYQSNYNILQLVVDIFSSDWFYDQKNIGTRIKSPVELIAGIRRMIPMDLGRPEVQLVFQKSLGQLLFYPPNVAGWPGGKTWIDSSTLMLRLRLPQILTFNEEVKLSNKPDDDIAMGREGVDRIAKSYRVGSEPDWKAVAEAFKKVKREHLLSSIADSLLQTDSRVPQTVLRRYSDDTSRESFIRTSVVQLMSTPEYQLC
ncbi:MAG: DUF1800 domain-containing protein [Chitinophagaceae bacterium]|nr:DUF1800 domain-containing protein [Chitinophagaceae bacterium]